VRELHALIVDGVATQEIVSFRSADVDEAGGMRQDGAIDLGK
jgi:hypothetical protein